MCEVEYPSVSDSQQEDVSCLEGFALFQKVNCDGRFESYQFGSMSTSYRLFGLFLDR